jgi:hypothetical protein
MASTEYWERKREALLGTEFGIQSMRPPSPDDILENMSMARANVEVVMLRVLGLWSEADRLLDVYCDPLRALLADPTICQELKAPATAPPALVFHLSTLAVAHWLKTAEFDLKTIRRATSEIETDEDYSTKDLYAPLFNDAMLLAVARGDQALVEKYYNRWEKKPLTELPTSLRYASNPRRILVAHFRYAADANARTTLDAGLERFAMRARQWEKMDAVPFIDISDLARMVFHCERLKGNDLSFSELTERIR